MFEVLSTYLANMSNFGRQILIFIGVWALLIYIFITKLNSTSGSKESEEMQKLNKALNYLEKTKSLDNELKQLLDEYANDITNGDNKEELLKRINRKFQDTPIGDNSMFTSTAVGSPSLEYEQYRRRVGNNILELWNFLNSEASKIEKTLVNEVEQSQSQSLKQLSNFVQLAKEHKRYKCRLSKT